MLGSGGIACPDPHRRLGVLPGPAPDGHPRDRGPASRWGGARADLTGAYRGGTARRHRLGSHGDTAPGRHRAPVTAGRGCRLDLPELRTTGHRRAAGPPPAPQRTPLATAGPQRRRRRRRCPGLPGRRAAARHGRQQHAVPRGEECGVGVPVGCRLRTRGAPRRPTPRAGAVTALPARGGCGDRPAHGVGRRLQRGNAARLVLPHDLAGSRRTGRSAAGRGGSAPRPKHPAPDRA